MDQATLYTLGHGDRSPAVFAALLLQQPVSALVDIRAQPHSSRFPHFSQDALRRATEPLGIQYHWAGRQLGGRRPAVAGSPHTALGAELRGFADYMHSEAFEKAAAQLCSMAAREPLVIVCAERLPDRCHRRLIADYLTLQGLQVIHLIDKGESREHLLSREARRESAQLVYDRQPSQ